MKHFSLISLALTSAIAIGNTNANAISLEQVTQDVTILADDKMAGRASFSQGNEEAASYIAKRFQQIGLSPLEGNNSFKQDFKLYQTQTENISVRLNGQQLNPDDVFVLTNHQSLEWHNHQDNKILSIEPTDDFAKTLSKFNQLDENLIIKVAPEHTKMFKRYQQYFNEPRNKLKIDTGPSAVLLLMAATTIDTFSLSAKTKVETKSLTNIVGVLPGQSKPDEMILFSAHYDHIGTSAEQIASDEHPKKERVDLIYNGADDDASGTSAVINLAQYFSQKKNNQRSLIFVAFAAEEIGGFGSRYFSENLDPDRITAMINIEMIGKPSKFGAGEFWMTGFDRSNLAELMNKNLKSRNKQIHPDPYPEQELFYRSDNATLARLGVPAHSFSSTQIDKDLHYHKVTDQIDTLDLLSMSKIIESIAQAVESIVNASDTPTRIDIKQVKNKGNYY